MENFVRRSVRPIASGRERLSSKGSDGDCGRKRRKEVRVCIRSILILISLSVSYLA